MPYSLYTATATKGHTDQEVVTLTLTADEAQALSTALAHVGWDVTNRIYVALTRAGIVWDEYQEFRPTMAHGCIIAVTD